MILAIDPSNKEHTAYVFIDSNTYKPIKFGMCNSKEMIDILDSYADDIELEDVVIEMVASYGLPVGKDVFETCVFIGRMIEHCKHYSLVYRKEVKLNLCGRTQKVNDTVIRQALINRFANFDFKNGKGSKKDKDFFYGFKGDIWSAYSVGVTYLDNNSEKGENYDRD